MLKLFGALARLFERIGGGVQPCALELFDPACVHKGGELRVDGHLGEQGKIVTLCGLFALALAEEIDLLPQSGQAT